MSAEPLPCLGCGATMRVEEAAVGLHANPTLSCAFCGRREPMPAEAAERHRFIRLRLQQLERARLTAEAPLATYRQIKTAMVPGFLFLIVGMGLSTFQSLTHQRVGHPPGMGELFPIAFIAGLVAGWAGMVYTFRSIVRPLLEARPPERAGMPATCRSCGGDLPAIKAAQVACPYCRADNVLGGTATERVGVILEGDFKAKMARGTLGDANVFSRPTRAFYVWGGVGVAVGLVGLQLVLMLR
jgi:hypothetical protein